MYKAVIFALGGITAERELNALRNGNSVLRYYFDSLKETDPIDGLSLYSPSITEPKRTLNMRPVEGRIGRTYILIVPTRGGAEYKGGGSVVDRKGYFEISENVVGIGLCGLISQKYQADYGDVIIPQKVDNSPKLRKFWGKEYYSGIPDIILAENLQKLCLKNEINAFKIPLGLSVMNLDESANIVEISKSMNKNYGSVEMEMGWVLSHARKLNKIAVGALVISDRSGDKVDMDYFYHRLPEKTHESVGKLLETSIQLFI